VIVNMHGRTTIKKKPIYPFVFKKRKSLTQSPHNYPLDTIDQIQDLQFLFNTGFKNVGIPHKHKYCDVLHIYCIFTCLLVTLFGLMIVDL
jgi:hypothetical protein